MIEPYTVALTSCGRFDLLEQTLDSLLPHLEGPLAKIVIAEDSGSFEVESVVRKYEHTEINLRSWSIPPPRTYKEYRQTLFKHRYRVDLSLRR